MGFHKETGNDNKYRMNGFQARLELSDLLNKVKEEENPFLNNQVKNIAEDVFSEAERQAKYRGHPMGTDRDPGFKKLSILKKNIVIIIEQFKMCKKAKQQFLNAFPMWLEARSQGIEALHTIGNSLNHSRRTCNIVRLVGSSTSFVGGGICIASAALIPFSFGLTTPLVIAGGVTTALGSATSIGTSVTENLLLKNKVEEAKEIVKEDKKSFEALQDWLIISGTVTEAMHTILSIDVDNKIKNILEILKNFVHTAAKVHSAVERIPLVREVVNVVLSNLPHQFLLVTVVSSLLGFLTVLAALYNLNDLVFSSASTNWEKITNHVSSVANASLGILQPAATLILESDAMVARNVAKAVVARGLVAAIGMSLDVVSIVLTSIDVHNGSVCEEGQKVIEAANKMKEEADIVEEVYNKLVVCSD